MCVSRLWSFNQFLKLLFDILNRPLFHKVFLICSSVCWKNNRFLAKRAISAFLLFIFGLPNRNSDKRSLPFFAEFTRFRASLALYASIGSLRKNPPGALPNATLRLLLLFLLLLTDIEELFLLFLLLFTMLVLLELLPLLIPLVLVLRLFLLGVLPLFVIFLIELFVFMVLLLGITAFVLSGKDDWIIFVLWTERSLTGSCIFNERRRLPIIPFKSDLVRVLSACLETPTFLAIRRKVVAFTSELKSFWKSLCVNGDFLSNKYDLSLLKTNGGNGNLPSWIDEYTSHIWLRVNFKSPPVFFLLSVLRSFIFIPGSHASILL